MNKMRQQVEVSLKNLLKSGKNWNILNSESSTYYLIGMMVTLNDNSSKYQLYWKLPLSSQSLSLRNNVKRLVPEVLSNLSIAPKPISKLVELAHRRTTILCLWYAKSVQSGILARRPGHLVLMWQIQDPPVWCQNDNKEPQKDCSS